MTIKVHGTDSHLYGRQVIALGIVGIVVGVVAVAAAGRAWVRQPAAGVLAVVGVVGLALMWHQYRQLSGNAEQYGRATGLRGFARFFGAHASAGWGFWLDVAAFATVVVAAMAVWWTPRTRSAARYRTRSAASSTGSTQPVRCDAAGGSTKVATWPNSSGSP
jgi:hypothetical protein